MEDNTNNQEKQYEEQQLRLQTLNLTRRILESQPRTSVDPFELLIKQSDILLNWIKTK